MHNLKMPSIPTKQLNTFTSIKTLSDSMITGFSILNVEGKIDSQEVLAKQRFPKLNINFEKVTVDGGTKLNISYTFVAEYYDSEAKDAKNIGKLRLAGTVEVTDSKDKITESMKKWTDSKLLPMQLSEEVINGISFRCGATGTLVAYSLGLIPPLMISSTKLVEEK